MSTIVIEECVRIPDRVVDLKTYRAWAKSASFPQTGRIAFLHGEVWVDMSPEEVFTHNQVKGAFAVALGALVLDSPIGWYFHDRTLVSNAKAGLSTEPDGTFVSYGSFQSGRVRLVKGKRGIVELEGGPDIVLEVVSDSSVKKDTVILRQLYWEAGVSEYWLVDARGQRPAFDLLRRGRSDWTSSRARAGWVASGVLGKSLRLAAIPDRIGYARFKVEVR